MLNRLYIYIFFIDLISSFGLDIILIFNAILLKRRILVYHHDVEKLQEVKI